MHASPVRCHVLCTSSAAGFRPIFDALQDVRESRWAALEAVPGTEQQSDSELEPAGSDASNTVGDGGVLNAAVGAVSHLLQVRWLSDAGSTCAHGVRCHSGRMQNVSRVGIPVAACMPRATGGMIHPLADTVGAMHSGNDRLSYMTAVGETTSSN